MNSDVDPNQKAILEFRELIAAAIMVRQKALYPDKPLFSLALNVMEEEITRHEQSLLQVVLDEFDRIFEV